MVAIRYIHLYNEPTASNLRLTELATYIRNWLPAVEVDVRDAFFSYYLGGLLSQQREAALARLAEAFARAKVRDPRRRDFDVPPLRGEIEYERRRLSQPQKNIFGLLYDGLRLVELCWELLPPSERSLFHAHIIFTNQLFGTWDEGDGRYHARVNLCAFPSLISTTGLVEAPAKPREYYFLKQQYLARGLDDAIALALEPAFAPRCVVHDDPRLTEIMKGYVLQAIVYQARGEAFCQDRYCRLYNAHWQEEVIAAQLQGPYEICPYHERLLSTLTMAE